MKCGWCKKWNPGHRPNDCEERTKPPAFFSALIRRALMRDIERVEKGLTR